MKLYIPGGPPALEAPRGYSGGQAILTKATDILAPSWTGRTTVTGTPSPDSPAAITGVPFAATATGPDGQTRSVDLGIIGYSLPDGTADTFDGVRGDFVQRIGRLVLDGTEGSYDMADLGDVIRLVIFNVTSEYPGIKYIFNSDNGLCSHFDYLCDWEQDSAHCYVDGINIVVYIPKNLLSSVSADAAKSWLAAQAAAGTPVTVYYELAEPIAYNQKADLQAFEGTTTVTGADAVEVVEGQVIRPYGLMAYEIVRSNPNLADNHFFLSSINQRGKMEYAGIQYGIDRWINTSAGTVKIENEALVIGKNVILDQRTEAIRKGQLVTFSVLIDNKLGSYTTVLYDAAWQQVPLGDTGLSTRILSQKNDFSVFGIITKENYLGSGKPVACKLEFGPHQTLAHKVGDQWVLNDPPPDPALELLKCQKYQIALGLPGANTHIGMAIANSVTNAVGFISLPTDMRARPKLASPVSAIKLWGENSIDVTNVEIYNQTHNGLYLSFTAQGLTPQKVYWIRQTAESIMLLDANL